MSGNLGAALSTSQIAAIVTAFKNGDTSRNTTVALAADPDLSVTLLASGIYCIRTQVAFTIAATGIGFRADFNGGNATINNIEGIMQAWDDNTGTQSQSRITALSTLYNTGDPNTYSSFWSTLVVDVNAGGTFALRWAQSNSSGSALVAKRGSCMVATKLN